MLLDYKLGQTSIVLRVKIRDSTVSTGAGKTGLTSASSGLIISTIADNESTATAYTVAGSNVETISTLGTFASPTASKCRFKEVDSTNHKGIYEIQIADARFAVSSAKSLLISVSGVTGAAECDVVIPLRQVNPYDAVRGGMTALPNAAADAAGGLPISDAGGLDLDAQRSDVAAILVDTGTTLDARIPAALVSGRMDASVGAYQSGLTPLQPTTAGRTLDVTATGAAGIDWANVENQAAGVILPGTTIGATELVNSGVVVDLVNTSAIDSGSFAAGAITPTAISAPLPADVQTIKTQTVTCAAGVTVGAFVGQGTAAIGVNASGHVSRVTLTDTLTTYTGNTPQTGDSYARIGSTGSGLTSLASAANLATVAGYIDTEIADIQSRLPAALVSGRMDVSVGAMAANTLTASALAADAASEIAVAVRDVNNGDGIAAVGSLGEVCYTAMISAAEASGYAQAAGNKLGGWSASGTNTVLGAFKALSRSDASAPSDFGGTFDPATDSTQAIRDRGDAAWTTATGFSTLDAAGIRTAVGLTSANLDTQLSTIDTVVDAILVDTGTTLDARIPAALVSGRMDVSVGAYQSGLTPLQPTTAGRTLDVTATGGAGIDWSNVENTSASVTMNNTTISANQVAASVTGDVAGKVLGGGSGTITAAGVWSLTDAGNPVGDYATQQTILASQTITDTKLNNIKVDTAAILLDTGTDGVVVADSSKTGYALTSGERDSIAAALLDLASAIETGLTPRGAIRLALSALAGKVSGAGTGTEVFRNAVADSKARITATVDGDGNRTAISTDAT